MVDDERSPDDSELPLDDGVYITDEDDTFEKMKRGLKKFGKDLKKGAEDIADSSKKLATKSKEKMDAALEERKRKKAMKDPLNFPWSNLTVSELKERLREMGLAVSGKKDQLVERILEHYRTEIPTDEDGTPQLIEELEPVPETPPAPDLDELVKIDEVEEVVEEVAAEIPIFQLDDSEQMYVYDPPTNFIKPTVKKNNSNKAINYVSFLFGLSMFFITLCILNKGFDFGWNVGFLYDFIADRFVMSYGGMSDVQVTSLAGALSLMLFFSSLMYFSGRHTAAALLVVATVVASISTRAIVALTFEGFQDPDELFFIIFDSILAIPFCISSWIPAIVKSGLKDYDGFEPEVASELLFDVNNDFLHESLTIADLSEALGERGMGKFDVQKPKRPRRRSRPGLFYEGIFVCLTTISWPLSIVSLGALASSDFRDKFGLPSDFNSSSLSGQLFLAILFAISVASTYIVYRYDRDARDGPLYAREKAAYQEMMDEYLDAKRAEIRTKRRYYEIQESKLDAMESGSLDPDKDD